MNGACQQFAADLRFFWESFVLMLVVLNPIATAALYVSIAARHGQAQRESMVRTASLVAFGIIAAFALWGKEILSALGISLASFGVAGGFLLLLVGFRILLSEDDGAGVPGADGAVPLRADLALTPLAIPILAGPASISAAILQAGNASRPAQWIGLLVAIGLATGLTGYVLLLAARGSRWLGDTAMKLFFRLAGLVLIAIAVQFILAGLEQTELVARLLA
ncbi:MAG: MarC family protein [Puniceicoccales bacterium]|jgi:multiple antibiotic resistance protein|nr:MarC family protein [Puniceicoccales bacterium]